MSVKVLVVKPQANVLEVEAECVYRGDCGKLINPNENVAIEMVWVNEERTLALLVDEDGLPKQLPINFFVEISSNPFHPVQAIVGTVLFVRFKKVDPCAEEIWDYELEDITEADKSTVKKLLNPELLDTLFRRYKNGESGFIG